MAGGLKTACDSIIFSYIMKKAILLVLLLWGGTRLFAATEAELQAQAERHYRTGNYPLALEDYDELLPVSPCRIPPPMRAISAP